MWVIAASFKIPKTKKEVEEENKTNKNNVVGRLWIRFCYMMLVKFVTGKIEISCRPLVPHNYT